MYNIFFPVLLSSWIEKLAKAMAGIKMIAIIARIFFMWRLLESNLFDRLESCLKNSDQIQECRLKAGFLRRNFSTEFYFETALIGL
jgi:hypothetical protein